MSTLASPGHVHFWVKPAKKGAPHLATVCQQPGLEPLKRTLLPTHVTCPGCMDWIAANHQSVVASVTAMLKRSA